MRFWRGFGWGAGTVAGLGVLGAVTLARPLIRLLMGGTMGGTMGQVTGDGKNDLLDDFGNSRVMATVGVQRKRIAPLEPRTILIWHDGKHRGTFEREEGTLYALTPEIAAITGMPLAWTDDEAPEMAGLQPDPWYFQRRQPLPQQPVNIVH